VGPAGRSLAREQPRASAAMRARTVLVEPGQLRREALAESLRDLHDVDVVAVAEDIGSSALQCQRVRPQVVVVAAALIDGVPRLCAEVAVLEPRVGTLVLDRHPDEETLLRSIEAGASGYVTGQGGLAGVAEAIRFIARGQSVVPPAMLGPLLRRLIERQREASRAAERLVALTPREREVLSLLVDGMDLQRIAATLVISPETARTHVQRVLRKLGVHSRLEAIALVAKSGMVDRLERMVERSAS
jgi:DNA-binding NarL/FixJ family response regulator